MRREAPSPFGTSLVDLLVSGLAMVAMLWVMNATNSGFLGTGEEETTSGMVLVEQFGDAIHMETVHLRLPGQWQCDFRLNWVAGPTVSPIPGCVAEPGGSLPDISANSTRLAFIVPGAPPGVETTVLLRQDKPSGGFFVSLTITVENLAGQNLFTEVGVEPCCDRDEPHYLRVLALSGAGEAEVHSFWHDAGRFTEVLANARSAPWILDLRTGIDNGSIAPVRTIFDAEGAGFECLPFQGQPPPRMQLVFETEGDISVSLPSSMGSSPAFQTLMVGFDGKLLDYFSRLSP